MHLHIGQRQKEGGLKNEYGSTVSLPSVVGSLRLYQWRMFRGLATWSTNFCPKRAKLNVL